MRYGYCLTHPTKSDLTLMLIPKNKQLGPLQDSTHPLLSCFSMPKRIPDVAVAESGRTLA